jgi:hypothetical protein
MDPHPDPDNGISPYIPVSSGIFSGIKPPNIQKGSKITSTKFKRCLKIILRVNN